MPSPYRVIAWVNAGQEGLLRESSGAKSLRCVAVGSASSAVAADLSRDLKAERFDDLRHAIQRAESDADLIWLVGDEQIDREVLRQISELNAPAFTCHPQPGSLGDLRAMSGTGLVRFAPLMRRAPGYRAAAQVLPDFGEIGAVNIAFRTGHGIGAGGLFARLYDAMDTVVLLCGEPLLIEAAFAGETGVVPESLTAMRGHLTMNLRFSENRCASVTASSGAGAWFRGVTILGDAGCLRISDGGFEWLDPAGRLIDSHVEDETPGPAELVVLHLVQVLENTYPGESPQTIEDNARLLAICEAARLSCRTGHGEAPRKILEMLSRP